MELNRCIVTVEWQNRHGKTGTDAVTCRLLESGAFAYGNGTYVDMEWPSGNNIDFDTRYTHAVINDFEAFCCSYLAEYYGPNRKHISTEHHEYISIERSGC